MIFSIMPPEVLLFFPVNAFYRTHVHYFLDLILACSLWIMHMAQIVFIILEYFGKFIHANSATGALFLVYVYYFCHFRSPPYVCTFLMNQLIFILPFILCQIKHFINI